MSTHKSHTIECAVALYPKDTICDFNGISVNSRRLLGPLNPRAHITASSNMVCREQSVRKPKKLHLKSMLLYPFLQIQRKMSLPPP